MSTDDMSPLTVDGIVYDNLNFQGNGTVKGTVNGHRIREWYSRVGRIYTVGDTDQASATLAGAESIALKMNA